MRDESTRIPIVLTYNIQIILAVLERYFELGLPPM